MTVQPIAGATHWSGLRDDIKPTGTNVTPGSTFIEIDTGHLYQFGENGWFFKGLSINTEETEGNLVSFHVNDDQAIAILGNILIELKKMNIQFNLITDEHIKNQEVG